MAVPAIREGAVVDSDARRFGHLSPGLRGGGVAQIAFERISPFPGTRHLESAPAAPPLSGESEQAQEGGHQVRAETPLAITAYRAFYLRNDLVVLLGKAIYHFRESPVASLDTRAGWNPETGPGEPGADRAVGITGQTKENDRQTYPDTTENDLCGMAQHPALRLGKSEDCGHGNSLAALAMPRAGS